MMAIRGPQVAGPLDFRPVGEALQYGQQVRQANAMMERQANADKRADQQLKIAQAGLGIRQQESAARLRQLNDPLNQERKRLEIAQIKANIARANMLADPAAKIRARMQIAGQLGLQPNTPEYQSFVISGGATQGKSFQTFYDQRTGKYYAAQPVDQGPPKIYPIEVPGQAVPSGGEPGAAPQPSPLIPGRAPKTVDTGTAQVAIGPDGRPVNVIPKEVAEAERQKKIGQNQGKVEANRNKATAAFLAKEQQVQNFLSTADEAEKMVNGWTAGLMGAALQSMPGSEARDLRAKLDTMKANVGFDRLQEMRDNSPTGGALGQVSEMENRLLQAAWASVEQSQSPAQLRANIRRLKVQYRKSMDRIRRAYAADYKAFPDWAAQNPPPPSFTQREPAQPQAPAAPAAPQGFSIRRID